MNFLEPAALLFGLSLPVVVVFYLLKRKRVLKLVSSTLLWQKFLAETQANAPFQRLRHNWLLLLQLLLLALVVLALMRPYLSGNARESQLRVIILDGSASMQATDETPSRFEKARAEALQWVNGLRDGEQMMLLLAGANTEVKQSPTSDKGALRRALQSCEPSDSTTRLADALKTAGAFTFEKRGEAEVTSGEIHLFSDGAAPDLDELANKNLPIVYHRIGSSGNNVGITRLDVRPHPEDPKQRAVLAAVANLSTNEQQIEVELLFNGELLQKNPLTLAPTNTEVQIFSAPQTSEGVFTVRLVVQDDLAVDNQASIVSFMPQPVRVLLVTKGNRFLEKAIKGAANVQLSTATVLADDAKDFDVCVLDDVQPSVWPKVNTLAIRTANTNWFPSWSTVTGPPIVDWKGAHPLLRFVNFDNVQVAETLAVKAPTWGIALVDSPQTPLVIAGEIDRNRLVWVGFDTLQSTWPLRISYPIFIANTIDWLNPANAGGSQFLVQPGNAFRLGLTEPVSSAQLTMPDGKTKALPVEPDSREIVVSDTLRQGIYKLKAGTNEVTFCANLMDSNESSIAPREELPLGKYGKVTATTLRRANVEWWRWLALAGLAVLLFEWWWYHKRTA
jgi:Ca-activated chloride channel homolog